MNNDHKLITSYCKDCSYTINVDSEVVCIRYKDPEAFVRATRLFMCPSSRINIQTTAKGRVRVGQQKTKRRNR